MRQSNLFTKTLKETPADEESRNAKLLIRAGFIDKVMAGVYTFLPLGNRVLKKIEGIIREEMDAIGSQEIYMPSLSPRSLWERTDRGDIDVLFEARGANDNSRRINDSSYILNPTHEEVVTPLMQKFAVSYKDLPVSVYHIQTKFRNEPRPKGGLLRGREFRMKDMYSFHTSSEDLLDFYEKSKKAYMNVFERLGIGGDTYITLASGGDFTKKYSHEFQTICPGGEDVCFYDSDNDICYNREVAPSRAPVLDDDKKEKPLEEIETRGIKTANKLAEFLGVEIKYTVKTLIYKADDRTIFAGLRGNYEVNEYKLKRVLDCKELRLATPEEVKEITGAEVGYAGLIDLPDEVEVILDDSLKGRINMEMGANKTDYHLINVNFGRDIPAPERFYDIKTAQKGDICPETGKEFKVLEEVSEVGNIFSLETKFSESFNYYYTGKDGKRGIVHTGSYGIGPTRLMGVIAEKMADEKGMIWPKNIAPYLVHLISLERDEESDKIYNELREEGIEVLYDDRGVGAGEKFADSDLIGCPVRIVVSSKTIEENSAEVKIRDSEEVNLVTTKDLIGHLKDL